MISTKNIKQYDDLKIFRFYVGDFVPGQMMLSPLRKEKTPSFNIFLGKEGYVFKDFGTGKSGNSIEFVSQLFNITYKAARRKIEFELEQGLGGFIGFSDNYIRPERKECDIKVKIRKFSDKDLEYWDSYGITKDLLKEYFVFSLSHYWINDSLFTIPKNQLCFGYWNDEKWKIYTPFGKVKWIGNQGSDVVQGWVQLPEFDDLLIVTKALKDVMVLRNLGYNSCAPQSETVMLSEPIIDDLRHRFKNLVVLFDKDLGGRQGALNYSKIGFKSIEIPVESNGKDISDFYQEEGYYTSKELIKYLING